MDQILEIVLRTIAVYIFMIIAIRLFGKKELSQISVVDLIFILLISNSVQNAMVGENASLQGGLIAASSLFVVNFILKNLLFKNKSLNRLLQGDPVMLVHHGVLLDENLNREKISVAELEAAIREHGVDGIEHVDLAVLETDGNISILSENYHKKSVRKRKSHKAITKPQ